MKWSIAQARQRFSELIRAAEREPQPIYNRDKKVGVLVNACDYEAFSSWSEANNTSSLADAFDELRTICKEEGVELATPSRSNRDNPLPGVIDEFSN